MIRKDFVSNSSSSSFIVSHEDNKFRIILDNPRTLTLKDYVKEFGRRDIFEYWCYSDRDKNKFKFVSPQRFSKLFGSNIKYTLPDTAKNYLEEYIEVEKNRPDCEKWDDPKRVSWSEKLDKLMNHILDCVYKALEPEWKKATFDYQEIDDNWLGSDIDGEDSESGYDYEDCDNMEEFVQEKIEYIEQLKGEPLKFFKIFGNH